MATYHRFESARKVPAEARVWQAVMLQAVQEWQWGPLRLRREAEDFLFNDNSNFEDVCTAAGMDVSRLRTQLNKLRGQSARIDRPIAA